MEFKPARCPSCGGELQVPDKMDTVKCMYCGSEIVVKEAIKAASNIVNLDNILELADTALDLSNYDEAYNYYNKILEFDSTNYKAWYGKALSDVGQKSDISQIDIRNIIKLITKANENTPSDKKSEILNKTIIKLSNIILVKYNILVNYFINSYITVDSYNLFFYKSNLAINLLSELNKYALNKGKILNDILQIYENYMRSYKCSASPNLPIVLRYEIKYKALEEIKKIKLELERIKVGEDKIIIGPMQSIKCENCGYVGLIKILKDSSLICRKCKTLFTNLYLSKILTRYDK